MADNTKDQQLPESQSQDQPQEQLDTSYQEHLDQKKAELAISIENLLMEIGRWELRLEYFEETLYRTPRYIMTDGTTIEDVQRVSATLRIKTVALAGLDWRDNKYTDLLVAASEAAALIDPYFVDLYNQLNYRGAEDES